MLFCGRETNRLPSNYMILPLLGSGPTNSPPFPPADKVSIIFVVYEITILGVLTPCVMLLPPRNKCLLFYIVLLYIYFLKTHSWGDGLMSVWQPGMQPQNPVAAAPRPPPQPPLWDMVSISITFSCPVFFNYWNNVLCAGLIDRERATPCGGVIYTGNEKTIVEKGDIKSTKVFLEHKSRKMGYFWCTFLFSLISHNRVVNTSTKTYT